MKELEAIRELARKWRKSGREFVDESEMECIGRTKLNDHDKRIKFEIGSSILLCKDELEALLPALETALREKSADIKATVLTMRELREPMSCTHPRACWKERDSKLSKGPMGTEYREGYCTACEDKRLAVAAALREAAKIADSPQDACPLPNFKIAAKILALISGSDRSALDAHDADTRNRALEEAATTAKQYGLGHEGDSIAAAIRALKREK